MSSRAATQRQPIQLSQAQTNPAAELAVDRPSLRLTRQEAETKPRWIWRVVQWKYNVDVASSRLKRLYFHLVFLNFNRFSYWAFDLLPPNGRDNTGRLCWTEDQGCWNTEWEAEQEAMRYRYGHAVRVPLNSALPCSTVHTEQIHPHSPPEVKQMYRGKTTETTISLPRLDVIKVAAKLAQSDGIFQPNP